MVYRFYLYCFSYFIQIVVVSKWLFISLDLKKAMIKLHFTTKVKVKSLLSFISLLYARTLYFADISDQYPRLTGVGSKRGVGYPLWSTTGE